MQTVCLRCIFILVSQLWREHSSPQSEVASRGVLQRKDALSHSLSHCVSLSHSLSLSHYRVAFDVEPHTQTGSPRRRPKGIWRNRKLCSKAHSASASVPRSRGINLLYFLFFIDKRTSEAVPLVSSMQRKDTLTQEQD